MSHQPKNYRDEGGDRTVIGGTLQVLAGGKIVDGAGNQAAAIADVPATTATASAAANAVAINGLLQACRGAGILSV